MKRGGRSPTRPSAASGGPTGRAGIVTVTVDLTKKENVRLLWGHLGEMEPADGPQPIRTGSDGRFSIKDPDPYFAVMAMDPSRRHGGIALLPKGERAEPLEIRLVPLVTVRGSFEGPGPGQQPSWTHVYVHLPEDPGRPLHLR